MQGQTHWHDVCGREDLVEGSGVCALIHGRQVAIFYLPAENPPLYAIDNHDPIGGANVLYRGIVGDIGGELVVASPLYKEHYALASGRCLEQPVSVQVWPARLNGDRVELQEPALAMDTAA